MISNLERKDFVDQLLTSNYVDENGANVSETVVASTIIKGVYYAAVECVKGNSNITHAVVVRFENPDDCTELKIFEENEGPYFTDCPLSILNLLSNTHNPYSLAWRIMCRKKANLVKL